MRFRFGGVYSGFLALCGGGVEGDFLFAAMGFCKIVGVEGRAEEEDTDGRRGHRAMGTEDSGPRVRVRYKQRSAIKEKT